MVPWHARRAQAAAWAGACALSAHPSRGKLHPGSSGRPPWAGQSQGRLGQGQSRPGSPWAACGRRRAQRQQSRQACCMSVALVGPPPGWSTYCAPGLFAHSLRALRRSACGARRRNTADQKGLRLTTAPNLLEGHHVVQDDTTEGPSGATELQHTSKASQAGPVVQGDTTQTDHQKRLGTAPAP